MKFIYSALIFSFLCGCQATSPSEAISNTSISQLKTISSEIKEVASMSVQECPEIASKLDLINSQIDGVKGQVENISLACNVEKDSLKKDITNRNIIIGLLGVIIAGLLVILVKFK